MLNGILGGWQISGIVQARSGSALLITQPSGISRSRPDVVPGEDLIVADWKDTLYGDGLQLPEYGRLRQSADERRHERDARDRAPTFMIWRAARAR